MKSKPAALLLALLIAVLLAAMPAAAKGQFTRVIVSGGTLDEPITVTDPMALWFLSLGRFERMQANGSSDVPADAAEVGYDLERQWEDGNGETQAFDFVRYHPNVDADESGYVYIVDTKIGQASYDEKWFPTTPEGDAAIRAVLAGETIACPVTPVDDSSGQPLYAGESIRLLPLKFYGFRASDGAAAAADSENERNVAGTVLLDETVRGNFWMDITWLQGVDFAPIRLAGATDWRDNLEFERIEPIRNAATIYEWESFLPEPGCYSVYVWAGSKALTIYVEMDEDV